MTIGEILCIWAIINFIVTVTMILSHDGSFSFVNPKVIYRHIKVNVFGTIVLAIIANCVFPLISVCYWIYKLCTVGRK